MQFDTIQRVYMIGIGGIGMSALARYFKYKGKIVSGYDKTSTDLTDALQTEGITIHFVDSVELLDKEADVVIYTPAIPKHHSELNFYLENNYTVYKRSKVLGLLSENKFCIAVAGSHGKTTVSSMISWILKHSGYDCTAFLGGISSNFQSNFVAGDNNVVIAEADEFDRSFLQLTPNIAVITATDSDHLEVYGSQDVIEKTFTEFANKVKPGGTLIIKSTLPIVKHIQGKTWRYALDDKDANLYAVRWEISALYSSVELNNGMQYRLTYPGIHNIENSVAAASAALVLGINEKKIVAALNTFKGVHRRFEVVYTNEATVFIDDYAHHPEEIKMFLSSVKKIYTNKKVTAIFQPHLYSRTNDLKEGFAQSLDIADEILLLPVYPARELPIEGVTSKLIFDLMRNPKKKLLTKEELLEELQENNFEVLCTIGAGDIDKLVGQIQKILELKQNK